MKSVPIYLLSRVIEDPYLADCLNGVKAGFRNIGPLEQLLLEIEAFLEEDK